MYMSYGRQFFYIEFFKYDKLKKSAGFGQKYSK